MIVNSLIAQKPSLKTEVVDVPEFGDGAQIMLSEMTALASAEFNEVIKRNRLLENKKTPIFFASLIALCAIDENGLPISDIAQAEEIAKTWNYELLFRVGEKAAILNGFMGDGVNDTKKSSGRTRRKAR